MTKYLLRAWVLVFDAKSVNQGVATTLYCSLSPDEVLAPAGGTGAGYFMDCAANTLRSHPMADDETLAKQLWEESERLTAPK